MRNNILGLVSLKFMPRWIARILVKTGLIHLMTRYFYYSRKSVDQVLNEMTDNKDLKAVLAYSFGDYGKHYCFFCIFSKLYDIILKI